MRRLKSINVFFNPVATSVAEIENIPNLKELVYRELFEAVSEAKKENKEITSLFELNNSGYILELEKDKWVFALEKAISHYEKGEEYEKCAKYKTLIDQIYEQRNKPNSRSNKQPVERKNTVKKERKIKKAPH